MIHPFLNLRFFLPNPSFSNGILVNEFTSPECILFAISVKSCRVWNLQTVKPTPGRCLDESMHGYGGSKSYAQLLTTMSLFQAWRVPGSLAVVVVVVVTLFWRSYWSLSLSLYIYLCFISIPEGLLTVKWTYHVFLCGFAFNCEVLLQIRMFWVKLYMTPFENIIHLFGHRFFSPKKRFRLQKAGVLWHKDCHMLNFGAATWIPSRGTEIVNHLLCTSKVIMKVALLTTKTSKVCEPLAFFFWWGAWWALRPYPTPGIRVVSWESKVPPPMPRLPQEIAGLIKA